jgi:hypothetical protein
MLEEIQLRRLRWRSTIAIATIKTIPTDESAMTANARFSRRESRMWGYDIDSWNIAMLVSLALAALAAVALVFTTFVVIRLQRQAEHNAEQSLKAYKSEAAERAAHLENDTATARKQTEQLKQLVSWRVISKNDEDQLFEILSKKPGSVNLLYTDGDPESVIFSDQFNRVLTSAGWTVTFLAYKSSSIVIGIAIPGVDAGDTKTLREAFSAAGIPFSANTPKTGHAAISNGEEVLTSFSQPMSPGVKLFIGSKALVVPQ